MPVFAVDTHLLWQVIWVSALAGVGISALFSLVIVAGARAGDAGRAGRRGAAVAFAALAMVALLLFAVGGIFACSSAIVALINHATPAAVSGWPMFDFTEPMRQKPRSFVDVRKACVSTSTSIGSPRYVPVPLSPE